VRTPQLDALAAALTSGGATVWREDDRLDVVGMPIEQIGAVAAQLGAVLYELSPQQASLEEAFMHLTSAECEYVVEQAQAVATTALEELAA
jgi:ABC-2 type transport system ATP-binding protein